MSFSIDSTEEVRICDISRDAHLVVQSLAGYLRQFLRMDSLQLATVRLRLSADGETVQARAKTDPRRPEVPPWENAPALTALIGRLEDASDITLSLSYSIMQTRETLYGAVYWEQVFRNGPVEGVSCRLLFRNVDDGPEYYGLGLSGDRVGLAPFDASPKDVSRVRQWSADAVRIGMDITDVNTDIGAKELAPLAEAFAKRYGLTIGYLADDSFLIDSGATFPADRVSVLLADLQRLRDHAAERGLAHTVESYLTDAETFAAAHIFENENGKISIEYCRV